MASLHVSLVGCVAPEEARALEGNTADAARATVGVSAVPLTRQRCTAMVHLCRDAYLIASASATEAGSQCVVQLVRRACLTSPTRANTSDAAAHGDDDGGITISATGSAINEANIPATLLAAFREPQVVYVMAQDEGMISTVELLLDESVAVDEVDGVVPRHSASSAVGRFAATGRRGSAAMRAASEQRTVAAAALTEAEEMLARCNVYLLLGTSNGTVLVCNALRATVLFMAQFQYHHTFRDLARSPPTDDKAGGVAGVTVGDEKTASAATSSRESRGTLPAAGRGRNQAVVRFAVLRRSADGAWHERRRVAGVYVVHEGGKVVLLNRAVLDALADVVRDRLDGRRPFFLSDWSPSSVLSTYPLVGPAAPQVAAHVTFVYTLPSTEAYSTAETQTCIDGLCGQRVIRDAVVLTMSVDGNPSRNSIDVLQTALHQGLQTAEALVVCGCSPAFALYQLDSTHRTFSATRAVKAVTSLVAGVAKSLWRGALGAVRRGEGAGAASVTTDAHAATVELRQRLEKRPQRVATALLAGDSNFTAVTLDQTARWLALYSEGAGRVYLADLSAEATVCRVLKGCRAAQMAWRVCHVTGDVEDERNGGDEARHSATLQTTSVCATRRVVLLFVHLPLRQIVEVYTLRSRRRVAACKVPADATLLSCEDDISGGTVSDEQEKDKRPRATVAVNAARVYLCTTSGQLYTVTLRFDCSVVATMQVAVRQTMCRRMRHQQRRACELCVRRLRACGAPGERLALALRLQPPWLPRGRKGQSTPPTSDATADAAARGAALTRAYMTTLQLAARTFTASPSTESELMALEWQPVRVAVPRTAADSMSSLADQVQRLQATLTRRQCAVILMQYMRVVRCYDKLRCMTSAMTAERLAHVGPANLARAELWQLTLDTAQSGRLRHTIADAVRATLAMTRLSDATAEAVLLQHEWLTAFFDLVRSATRQAAGAAADDETGTPVLQLSAFVSLFSYGEATLRLRHARLEEEAASDSRGAARDLAALADVLFAENGLCNFSEQLGVLAELGLSFVEVAAMVLAWLARSHAAMALLLLRQPRATSVGLLVSVLHSLPLADFAVALELVSLPLLASRRAARSDDDDAAAPPHRLRPMLTILLLCCVLRCGGEAVCGDAANGEGDRSDMTRTLSDLSLTLRQLLQLWAITTSESTTSAAPTLSDVTREQTCVSLRLRDLLPRAGTTDTLESHALRHGASLTAVMHGLHARLARSSAVLTTAQLRLILPFLYRRATTVGRRRSSMTAVCAGWVQGQTWRGDAFDRGVLAPLQRGWAELTDDGTATTEPRCQLFQQSCLLVIVLDVLGDVLRPLTDTTPDFWRCQAVPDVDLFAAATGDARGWLRGSRATRDYLQSAHALAHLALAVTDGVIGGAEAPRCVQLVQVISAHLDQDGLDVLPIVPTALRELLASLMRVLAQRPRQVVHRVHAVRRLLALLLFCMDAATFTVDGTPIAPLQRLPIRWPVLLAVAPTPSALVVVPSEIVDDVTTDPVVAAVPGDDDEMQVGRQMSEAVREASGLMRAFLADCVLADQPVALRCQRLVSYNTRTLLDRLAAALGLSSLVPDMTALTLVDYAAKYVMPVGDQLVRETWWIGDKGLLARLAASDMRALLGCYLKSCVELRRRCAGQPAQSALSDEHARRLRGILRLMSAECRCWVRQQGRSPPCTGRCTQGDGYSAIEETEQFAPGDSGAVALARVAVGGPDWVTQHELEAVDKAVRACLDDAVPADDGRRRLRELFFVLAQLIVEGDATALPPDTRRIAEELPAVAEGLRAYI